MSQGAGEKGEAVWGRGKDRRKRQGERRLAGEERRELLAV